MLAKPLKYLTHFPHLVQERFIRASGPGGQNVNKVSTAVELRFDIERCAAFTAAVKDRIRKLAGRSLTENGILILQSDRFRTQERNRKDVRERLEKMIDKALIEPRTRVATRPSRATRKQRQIDKVRRALLKKQRRSKFDFEKD